MSFKYFTGEWWDNENTLQRDHWPAFVQLARKWYDSKFPRMHIHILRSHICHWVPCCDTQKHLGLWVRQTQIPAPLITPGVAGLVTEPPRGSVFSAVIVITAPGEVVKGMRRAETLQMSVVLAHCIPRRNLNKRCVLFLLYSSLYLSRHLVRSRYSRNICGRKFKGFSVALLCRDTVKLDPLQKLPERTKEVLKHVKATHG